VQNAQLVEVDREQLDAAGAARLDAATDIRFFRGEDEQVGAFRGFAHLYVLHDHVVRVAVVEVVLDLVLDHLPDLVVRLEGNGDLAGDGVMRIDTADDRVLGEPPAAEDLVQRVLQLFGVGLAAALGDRALDVALHLDLLAAADKFDCAHSPRVDFKAD